MICESFRYDVLNADVDEPISFQGAEHLRGCDGCRTWHARYQTLECEVAELPIPRTTRKDAFLTGILTGRYEVELTPDPPLVPAPSTTPWGQTTKERGLRKLSLALSLAAALLIFSLGWSLWPESLSPTISVDHAVVLRAHRDGLVAEAKTPQEKVVVLAKFADHLQKLARRSANGKDKHQLETLSLCFEEVVCEDLVAFAKALPLEERQEVLQPIVNQLAWTESEFQRMIVQQESAPPAFLEIARAARTSHDHLTSMLA